MMGQGGDVTAAVVEIADQSESVPVLTSGVESD